MVSNKYKTNHITDRKIIDMKLYRKLFKQAHLPNAPYEEILI